jgi:hypothetical protein
MGREVVVFRAFSDATLADDERGLRGCTISHPITQSPGSRRIARTPRALRPMDRNSTSGTRSACRFPS